MTVEARPAARPARVGWLERLRAPSFAEGLFLATLAALLFLIGPPIFFLLRGSLSGTRGRGPALSLDAYAAVPGIIRVVGWIFLLGPRSGYLNEAARRVLGDGVGFDIFAMAGMVLVETLFWVPVVFLLMAMPLRSMDPALEEAAAMSGARPLRVLRSITLRLALPAIL